MRDFRRVSCDLEHATNSHMELVCLSSKEAMARMISVAMPLAVLYALVLLESRTYRGISNPQNPSVPFQIESHYAARALQDATAKQVARDVLGEVTLHRYWRDSSGSSRGVPKLVSVRQKLPSCVFGGSVAKSFLVIFMGHSGSSAIISELRSHSRVLIDKPEPIDHDEYAYNTSRALKYTRSFFSRGIREGKVAGFKMRPWHIGQRPGAWIALAEEFNTRIIWQYRRNILKQAVGEYSKKYYNDNSSVEGLRGQEEINNRCKTGAGCRFKISDFELFHGTLKDCLHSDLAIARGVNQILNGSTCVHDLPYEDYLYHREETIRVLQRFLGVEYEPTTPKRFKATSDSLCKVIENWDEVCEKFYGCHVWRHMFEDARNGCSCDFSSGSTEYCGTVYKN